MEQECIAEERAREKETAEGKEELPRKFIVKGLVDLKALKDLNKLFKKFENTDPQTGFHW